MLKKMLIVLAFIPLLANAQFDVSITEIADGYVRPADIVNAGDERLFVIEQEGMIKILYTDGAQESVPFLDISDRVDAQGNEKGLLGLAFPPDYCTSGVFYVNYTHTSEGQLVTRISRFQVNPEDENDGLENSEQVLLSFDQPYSNHNGGQLEFGPEGYLFVGTGDGGDGGDPDNNAQNLQNLLGKLLRIDVSGATPGTPYTIPPDNPFVDVDSTRAEIWAFGLRNPWKYAFDPQTDELYIGDVGQSNREEVNYVPANSGGGQNFGWRCYEGTAVYDLSECEGITDFTAPIFDYAYGSSDDGFRCSNTGGRVYRGPSFPALVGKFIDVDYCSGEYWLHWQEDGEWQNFHGTGIGPNVVAFGTDVWGEMYAVSGSSGKIFRVEEASGSLQPPIILSGENIIESTLEGDSYIWYYNGSEIDSANGQSIAVGENGNYTVQITSSTGCTITSPPVPIVISSIEDHESVRLFKIFPNPSQGQFSLKIQLDSSNETNLEIGVFDLHGKEVFTVDSVAVGGISKIDTGNLQAGLYFVHCRTEAGKTLAIRKIIIN